MLHPKGKEPRAGGHGGGYDGRVLPLRRRGAGLLPRAPQVERGGRLRRGEGRAGLWPGRQRPQLHQAVNKEARGSCNLLLQDVAWLTLQGKRETGTRLWHQIPQQFIFKPSDKALQEYSQVTEPAHNIFFSPLETQKKSALPLFLSYFLICV